MTQTFTVVELRETYRWQNGHEHSVAWSDAVFGATGAHWFASYKVYFGVTAAALRTPHLPDGVFGDHLMFDVCSSALAEALASGTASHLGLGDLFEIDHATLVMDIYDRVAVAHHVGERFAAFTEPYTFDPDSGALWARYFEQFFHLSD